MDCLFASRVWQRWPSPNPSQVKGTRSREPPSLPGEERPSPSQTPSPRPDPTSPSRGHHLPEPEPAIKRRRLAPIARSSPFLKITPRASVPALTILCLCYNSPPETWPLRVAAGGRCPCPAAALPRLRAPGPVPPLPGRQHRGASGRAGAVPTPLSAHIHTPTGTGTHRSPRAVTPAPLGGTSPPLPPPRRPCPVPYLAGEWHSWSWSCENIFEVSFNSL